MSLSCNKANTLFRENKIRELASTTDGLKFLKLRSLSRKEYMAFLIEKKRLDVENRKSRDWLEILYESRLSMALIDSANYMWLKNNEFATPFGTFQNVKDRIKCDGRDCKSRLSRKRDGRDCKFRPAKTFRYLGRVGKVFCTPSSLEKLSLFPCQVYLILNYAHQNQ
jgi:hypothetical protein